MLKRLIWNEKFKRISSVIVVLIFLTFLSVMGYRSYIDYYYNMPFAVKQEEFKLEYGSKISNNIADYIEVTNEEKYHEDETVFHNSTDNMKVGVYDCRVDWRKTGADFKIIVEDTQAPEIIIKEEKIKIDYAAEYDLNKNIQSVTDPVDGDIEYKIEGELKNKEPGDQKFKIIATDKNGNEVSKEFIVNVGKKPWPKEYSDDTCKITITKEWYKNAWCYIAHLEFTDYARFGTSCANGKYRGGNERIESAHKRLNAILTVNGCYSAPYLNYPVARSGKVCNNKGCTVPAVYSRSNGKLMSAWETGGVAGIKGHSLSSLVSSGKVSDTFCFGPPILQGGRVTCGSGGGRAQRTTIGTNGKAGDIWIVVSDGRYVDGSSPGLTFTECANLMKSKGCNFAVPLDGGGSSGMMFQGKLLNKTSGRAVVDFVYFK